MTKLDYHRLRYRGRSFDAASPTGFARGPWTHIKRAPVRTFSKAEVAQWEASTSGAADEEA